MMMFKTSRCRLKLLIVLIVIGCFMQFLFIQNISWTPILVFFRRRTNIDDATSFPTCQPYCYSQIDRSKQIGDFGTKSNYDRIKINDFVDQTSIPNCKPIKFWSLFRHGARTPSADEIEGLTDLYEVRNRILKSYSLNEKIRIIPPMCKLCDQDLDLLKNWSLVNISESDHRKLTRKGWRDLSYLAKSYQTAFPELFDQKYTPEAFRFRCTNEDRTQSSYTAFVDRLFGNNAHKSIHLEEPQKKDPILKPYSLCKITYKRSLEGFEESEKFLKQDPYQSLIHDVCLRLGLSAQADVEIIWKICQFEHSWNENEQSPWCAPFSPAHLKILDFYEDLNLYYMKSYGQPMNTELACETVLDMLNHLRNENEQPKVVAYFVHSTLMFLYLSTLGILRDGQPLMADNYYQMKNRRFKSSRNVPLSANFAAIKYLCTDQSHPYYKVMFLLNQKPIHFMECNQNGICTWDEMEKVFHRYTMENCRKTFCTNQTLNEIETNNRIKYF